MGFLIYFVVGLIAVVRAVQVYFGRSYPKTGEIPIFWTLVGLATVFIFWPIFARSLLRGY